MRPRLITSSSKRRLLFAGRLIRAMDKTDSLIRGLAETERPSSSVSPFAPPIFRIYYRFTTDEPRFGLAIQTFPNNNLQGSSAHKLKYSVGQPANHRRQEREKSRQGFLRLPVASMYICSACEPSRDLSRRARCASV